MNSSSSISNTNRSSVDAMKEDVPAEEKLKVRREKLKNYVSQFQQEFSVVKENIEQRKVTLLQNNLLLSTITTKLEKTNQQKHDDEDILNKKVIGYIIEYINTPSEDGTNIDKIIYVKNTITSLQDQKDFAIKDSDAQNIADNLREQFINDAINKLKQAEDINECLIIEKETNYFFDTLVGLFPSQLKNFNVVISRGDAIIAIQEKISDLFIHSIKDVAFATDNLKDNLFVLNDALANFNTEILNEIHDNTRSEISTIIIFLVDHVLTTSADADNKITDHAEIISLYKKNIATLLKKLGAVKKEISKLDLKVELLSDENQPSELLLDYMNETEDIRKKLQDQDTQLTNKQDDIEYKQLGKDLNQKIRNISTILKFFYEKLKRVFRYIKKNLLMYEDIHDFSIQQLKMEYMSRINYLKEIIAMLENKKNRVIDFKRVTGFLTREESELESMGLAHILSINTQKLEENNTALREVQNELNDISNKPQYELLSPSEKQKVDYFVVRLLKLILAK